MPTEGRFEDLLGAVLQCGCVVHVDLLGDVDGGVAEAAGDAFGRRSMLDKGRGVCMSEGVRIEALSPQHITDAAGADEFAGFVGADEVELRIAALQAAGTTEHTSIVIDEVVGEIVLEDGCIARLYDPPGGELSEELLVNADRARARRGLRWTEVIPVQARDVDELVVDGDGLAPEVNVAPAQAERFADAHARMIKEQARGVEHRPGRVCLQQCVKTLGRYDRPLDDLLGRFGRYADVLGWIATDDACRIDSVLQTSLQDGERGLC